MPEIERNSFNGTVSVEDLLKLKRAEKPSAEFWTRFEHDLQQKQLRALVRPSFYSRAWNMLSAPRHSWRALTAAVGGAAVIAFGVFSFLNSVHELEIEAELLAQEVPVLEMASVEPEIVEEEAPAETVTVRSGGAFFVVDALRPDERPIETFRTVANPETWTGGRGGSDSYAVNTFTTRQDYLVESDRTIDF